MQASNSCLFRNSSRTALAWTGILPSLSSVCLHHLLRVFWHRLAAVQKTRNSHRARMQVGDG